MARAVQIRAHSSDPQEWLAGVLRDRFREVLAERDTALDPAETEGIHAVRVAIRRLRSVIRDFAEIVEGFPLRDVRKDLARLADTLGEVRDTDVAIEALEKLRKKAGNPEIAKTIDGFIERYRDKRSKAFEKLRPRLSGPAIEKLAMRFEKALNSALAQRSLFATSNFEGAKDEIISNRVDDFMKLADSLYDPNQISRLHRLRISAKHLRYAVELFASSAQAEKNEIAGEVAKMQSYLGTLHDCDLWIAQFQAGLKLRKNRALKGPDRRAAEWLLSQFVNRRNKAYRAALELWSEWESDNFLRKLAGGSVS